jgi:hypothetical protein
MIFLYVCLVSSASAPLLLWRKRFSRTVIKQPFPPRERSAHHFASFFTHLLFQRCSTLSQQAPQCLYVSPFLRAQYKPLPYQPIPKHNFQHIATHLHPASHRLPHALSRAAITPYLHPLLTLSCRHLTSACCIHELYRFQYPLTLPHHYRHFLAHAGPQKPPNVPQNTQKYQ